MKRATSLLGIAPLLLAACQGSATVGVSELSGRGGLEQPVIQLFPQRNLDGWKQVWWVDNRPRNIWVFDDREGFLINRGQPLGFLRTERTYKDFVLSFDWRFHPNTRAAGDGGVMMRITGEDLVWPRSIEAQILPLHTGDVVAWRGFPVREERGRTNGEFTFRLKDAEKRAGEWNHYRITLQGDHMIVELNGEVVNEVWGLEHVAGHIGFQNNGPEIHYRNVELRPLER